MKNPNFRYIISYITLENKFVEVDCIVDELMNKTGKNRSSLKLYVYTTLKRLHTRKQLIYYKIKHENIVVWGLPNWLDLENEPLLSHYPKSRIAIITSKPLGVKKK